ncbi:MAG: glycosyltransferase [Candidatus Omnitrophica bacterium]|nr:glycosyltransferase [Candidatus Omnitrophota bacterium]
MRDSIASHPQFTLAYAESLPKFDRGVSWLCWAYNEEALIEGYLLRAHELLEKTCQDYEIVVVDDASVDQTASIVQALQKRIPQIRLIQNPVNVNVGLSSQRAIQGAAKEFLFWQPIDWCYDLTYLRIFLELLKNNDIVAGVRRNPVENNKGFWKPLVGTFRLFGIKHITRRSDTVRKAFVSVINYLLIRFFFRVPLSDYQNIVFYRTRLIQSIRYESKSSFTNPEGIFKCHWQGALIVEVPISFIPRELGEAKGTKLKAIWSSVSDIFRLWWKWMILGTVNRSHGGRIERLNPSNWESNNGAHLYENTSSKSCC